MPSEKVSAPRLQPRGRRYSEQEPSDQAETARSRCILNESGPRVNISRRSPLVPASILALIAFAISFLAGHVAATITGWHCMVYVGVGVGIWLVVSCFVAFVFGSACGGSR